MRIQHNIMAMSAYRNYTNNVSAMKKNLEKLSSGYKINRAGDDAAGLAISEKMRAQITGLETAQKNAKDGISLVQTAEGALTEVHDMLNRMVELATQSANGTYDNTTDRAQMQKEIEQLKDEINRIADSSNFNGIKLLDGSLSTQSGGAITNITSTAYQKASSADGAIKVDFVRERPIAATGAATKASFEVSLDDLGLKGVGASATGVKVTLVVNGQLVATATLTSVGTTSVTASAVAQAILSAVKGAAASKVTGFGKASGSATGSAAAIKIGDALWTVKASNGKLKFEQADAAYMDPVKDSPVIPDKFSVAISVEGDGVTYNKPNVNEFVQNTKYYDPSGKGLQARTEMTIDFAKLKDGDTIKVGSTSYTLKLVEGGASATSGVTIDLSKLDLTKVQDQKMALAKIVEGMASNTEWSAGNAGAERGIGKITFQSISTTAGASDIDLSNESKVMARFEFKSDEVGAKASFEVDPTKIKEGDTFTINGVTYEFTSSSKVSQSGNIAVNLGKTFTDEGTSLTAAQVASKVKAAILTDKWGTAAKYDVKIDPQNSAKLILTAKDNALTDGVKEQKNSIKVVSGGGMGLTLQIGDTADSFNQLKVSINDCHTESLGISDLSIATQDSAQEAVAKIKDAINYVSDVRGTLGATQNRLDHTINNLGVMQENIQDAESTIRDTDVAAEMMEYTKNNILIQSAQAMLAQANQVPQGVLQLLG